MNRNTFHMATLYALVMMVFSSNTILMTSKGIPFPFAVLLGAAFSVVSGVTFLLFLKLLNRFTR